MEAGHAGDFLIVGSGLLVGRPRAGDAPKMMHQILFLVQGDLAHKVGVVVKEGQRVGDGKERGKWGKS